MQTKTLQFPNELSTTNVLSMQVFQQIVSNSWCSNVETMDHSFLPLCQAQ